MGSSLASPFSVALQGGLGVQFSGSAAAGVAASVGLRDLGWPIGLRIALQRGPLGLSTGIDALAWLDESSGSTYLGGGAAVVVDTGSVCLRLVAGYAWNIAPGWTWTLEGLGEAPVGGDPSAFTLLTGVAYRIP